MKENKRRCIRLISTSNVQIILSSPLETSYHRPALPTLPFASLAPIFLKATPDFGASAIASSLLLRISNRHPRRNRSCVSSSKNTQRRGAPCIKRAFIHRSQPSVIMFTPEAHPRRTMNEGAGGGGGNGGGGGGGGGDSTPIRHRERGVAGDPGFSRDVRVASSQLLPVSRFRGIPR